jgi:hypothetical protein
MNRGGEDFGHRKKRVKSAYLVLLFLIGLGSSIYFLRQNNLKMVGLRTNVIEADKTGKNLSSAIKDLNEHIFRHMNTTTVRPVELVNSYNRQAKKIIEGASKSNNKDIYKKATAACETRGVPLTSIAQCAADYALKNSSKVGPQKIVLPDKSLFIYSFVSPRWTPDLAGLSLLLTVVIAAWLVIRSIEYVIVRLVIRSRLKKGL